MHCPFCRSTDTRVLDSRVAEDGSAIRRRRTELLADPGGLLELLRDGSRRARERAGETMALVRGALGMDYDRLLARHLA